MLNTRPSTKNKVLNYFFLNEHTQVYINELARLMNADPKNIFRALVQLQTEGFLKSEFKGKERYFSAHTQNSIYKGCRDIFLKTVGLEHTLRDRLKTVGGLKEAYIFGSYAKGELNAASDIDLLLVGEHKILEAQKILHKIQKESGREINVVNMRSQELRERKKRRDQFIKTVFSGKVVRLI